MAPRGVAGWRPDRLREARIAAGLSQGTLARLVGVSEHTIGTWERRASSRAASSPTAHHLASMAHALHVSAPHLAPLPKEPRLRHLRQLAGLTQADVAAALDISIGSVGGVEAGRWWPSGGEQWAHTYGVSLALFREAWEAGRASSPAGK